MARDELDELMAAWRAEPAPPSRPDMRRQGTFAVAAALRQVAERRQRQRRLRRGGALVSIAAGVFGVALAGWFEYAAVAERDAPSEARVLVAGSEGEVTAMDELGHVVDAASSLTEGSSLRTGQGSARLGFPSGALAQVSSRSSLRLIAAQRSEALFLANGRVDVEVPKLDAERGFSVETPDTRVIVHGTRFSVNVVADAAGPHTRVGVSHGVVTVTHAGREVRLTAGQVWPPAEALASQAQVAPEMLPPLPESDIDVLEGRPQHRQRKPARSERRSRRDRAEAVTEVVSRELAEHNRLFAHAMQLKKNGESRAALDELTKLTKRYPASPLDQELRVERLRLLQSLGLMPEAQREARAYLRDFPNGYAEREAAEILAERP